MSLKRQILNVFTIFCLLQWMWKAVGQNTGVLSITRLKDGDIFTRITNGNHSKTECRSWFAVDVASFSKENCSLTCKCRTPNDTFSARVDRCINAREILKLYNCSGPILPRGDKPLYDFTKPGKARLNASYLSNHTDNCRITKVEYFNGTEQVKLTEDEARLNVSRTENGTFGITWETGNTTNMLQGNILKLHILCDEMTSPNSCVLIKTAGAVTKNSLKERQNRNVCADHLKTGTDDMLVVYILVGVGSGFVFVGLLVGLFACYHRRRRHQRTRTTVGSRRPFKARTSNKGNEPTMPAIHDLIFNGLTWDGGDGGFSNRAISDSRFFEVDYGIPVDFSGSLTRPESSCESIRNSLSALTTEPGETGGR